MQRLERVAKAVRRRDQGIAMAWVEEMPRVQVPVSEGVSIVAVGSGGGKGVGLGLR